MKLINIGFGNMVSAGRLIAIVSPESAPIKRMVQEARDRGVLIDATYAHHGQRPHRSLGPTARDSGRAAGRPGERARPRGG